jgi:hypothetical protein
VKVTNLTSGAIYLKDLRIIRQGQTEARRAEDRYIGAGKGVYLPDTSEVLRSAQKGDLFQFSQVGKLRLNDTLTLGASPGPGNSITIDHGLGYIPSTVLLKKVMVGPTVTWVDATGTVDIVHNADFTETTITNTVGAPIEFLLRIG